MSCNRLKGERRKGTLSDRASSPTKIHGTCDGRSPTENPGRALSSQHDMSGVKREGTGIFAAVNWWEADGIRLWATSSRGQLGRTRSRADNNPCQAHERKHQSTLSRGCRDVSMQLVANGSERCEGRAAASMYRSSCGFVAIFGRV